MSVKDLRGAFLVLSPNPNGQELYPPPCGHQRWGLTFAKFPNQNFNVDEGGFHTLSVSLWEKASSAGDVNGINRCLLSITGLSLGIGSRQSSNQHIPSPRRMVGTGIQVLQ